MDRFKEISELHESFRMCKDNDRHLESRPSMNKPICSKCIVGTGVSELSNVRASLIKLVTMWIPLAPLPIRNFEALLFALCNDRTVRAPTLDSGAATLTIGSTQLKHTHVLFSRAGSR